MKNFKKIASAIAALSLAACVAVPMSATVFTASAEAVTNGSITITTTESDHTYKAYQIFDGDLDKSGEPATITFSNVVWGSAMKDETDLSGLYTDLQNLNITDSDANVFADCDSAAKVAKALEKVSSNADRTKFEDIDRIAAVFENYIKEDAVPVPAGDYSAGKYVITINNPGYYLVKDEATRLASGEAYTKYILQVAGDAELAPKADAPEVMKKVQEKSLMSDGTDEKASFAGNTEYPVGDGYNDIADYNIGDDVPFKLYGSMPETLADYKQYKYVFHDTLGEEFTLAENFTTDGVTVKIGNEVVDKGSYTVTTTNSDGCSIEIAFTDIKVAKKTGESEVINVTSDSIVTVEYSAKLNSNAKIGIPGQRNKVKLEYSNNPNQEGSGTPDSTGETPEDGVIVFTYGIDIDKHEESAEGNKLANAVFAVYKLESGSKKYVTVNEDKTFKELSTTTPTKDETNGWTNVPGAFVSASSGNIEIKGLDAGDYYIEELEAPAGFNALNKTIKVTVKPTMATDRQAWTFGEDESSAQKALTALEVANEQGDVTDKSGSFEYSKDDTITGSTDKIDGKADGYYEDGHSATDQLGTVVVINNKGATLPSTGGIGTTLFYLGGGALVAVAGVMLITKKRMTKD